MPRPSGKRGTFTFRVTAALREKLETRAAADARPISEVIEAALEQSFQSQGATLEDVRAIIRDEVVAAVRAALTAQPQANSLLGWYGQTRSDLFAQYGEGKSAVNPSPSWRV